MTDDPEEVLAGSVAEMRAASVAEEVEVATEALMAAEVRRVDAIVEMHRRGASLARIGRAAGMTKAGVRKLLQRVGEETA